MTWLREAVTDGKSQGISSSRIVLLVSGLTLSVCTLILTVAAIWQQALVPALTVFGGSLATMSGAGYVTTKWASKDRSEV